MPFPASTAFPARTALPRRAALLTLGLLLPLIPATRAAAAPPVVVQRSLIPTTALPNTPVSATLSVTAPSCTTVDELGVAVRDSAGRNVDFPGSTGRVQICPGGYTFTSGQRAYPAGSYQEFGFYRIGSTYYNLTTQTLTVAPPTVLERGLTPTTAAADTPVAATLKLASTGCLTVDEVGVGVRDAQDNVLDFPGSATNVQICPTGYTFTSGQRAFPAGSYREFGWYRIGSTYHNLTSQTLTVNTPTVEERDLTPVTATAEAPVAATLKLASTGCLTVDEVGVGVRDAQDNNLDFPGSATNVQICPTGYTFTSGQRAFPAGTYREFGWYRTGSTYHNLPERRLVVTAGIEPPGPIGQLAFDDEFGGPLALGSTWNDSKSSAYRYGNHNPDDDKLDWIQPSATTVADGDVTFTATPGANLLESGKRSWNTGLITTESTSRGFMLRPGDYAEVRLQLPTGQGAWPALWTWKDGGNEIDTFEYHPDNPNLLELSNRMRPAGLYYEDPKTVYPGAWITIGVRYGATNNEWYLNGKRVFEDHTGVGANWSAYLILNLSIVSGRYHPAPNSTAPIVLNADYLRVYRGAQLGVPGLPGTIPVPVVVP
ncbi:glycoside hydrolase family 16 protein [Kitasatospora viridis]|uniref:Beta-glucanase (GH16 family) n=1 Tax=Kitasatospora viridis TaxID=281105 RepID=A0A561UQG0_9ACTN|nr:hypothetical protein [Kitasatospora viridis]TWG01595.1 beta-glucanase (GH16 family) [Kitasatospora viridis]